MSRACAPSAEAGIALRPAGRASSAAPWSASSRSRANAAISTALPPFLGRTRSSACRATKSSLLATGSQGEPRAALARIAEDEHPAAELAPGDTRHLLVAHDSRQREGASARSSTRFVDQGVEVVTDRNALVHVSGHPRRAEMREDVRVDAAAGSPFRRMASRCISPNMQPSRRSRASRGGARAQRRHRALSRRASRDVVGKIEHGRRLQGRRHAAAGRATNASRSAGKLSFAGVVSIALALTPKGDMAGDPDVMIAGLPERTREGAAMDEIIDAAMFETFDSLPRGKRRDPTPSRPRSSAPCAARRQRVWGKKPQVHVLVVEV